MVGSRNYSEFALAPERALMASCKFGEILSTALDGSRVIDLFQERVVGDFLAFAMRSTPGEGHFVKLFN